MTISELRCTCQKCKHVFDAEYVTNAPIAVAAASMEAIRCPKCGGSAGLGGNYDDAPPPSAPIEQRVIWWKTRGERGTSSNTIFHAFAADVLPDGRHDIPYDPDDFRRCRLLLALFPEWRTEIGVVADRYPQWRPFTDRWAEMEMLFAQEFPKGTAPKLYALMKVAEAESRKIRTR